jgi:hypothetical protein
MKARNATAGGEDDDTFASLIKICLEPDRKKSPLLARSGLHGA